MRTRLARRMGELRAASTEPGRTTNVTVSEAARRRRRGQGLVEFALVVPLLILILLIAIDVGRLFYTYVAMNNAARIAANYASTHADSWPASGVTPNARQAADQAEFAAQISRDTAGIVCSTTTDPITWTPNTAPPRGPGDGHTATVALRCTFTPLTPLMGEFAFELVASDTFPIRSGLLAGTPLFPELPTPTPTPTPTTTAAPTPTATPGGPTPTPSLAPGECRVGSIIGRRINDVTDDWTTWGFQSPNLTVQLGNGNYFVREAFEGGTAWDGTTVQDCDSFALVVGP